MFVMAVVKWHRKKRDMFLLDPIFILTDEGAIWMTGVLNEAIRKGIPEEWRTGTITPIYKQKSNETPGM